MPIPQGFWSEVSDTLAPTYLPRGQTSHPRASPGLASLSGLHKQARMLLVLPELDTLAEQSETWVRKVVAEGRGADLRVERFKGRKHGWTQMPEGWLDEEEKRTRVESFADAVRFTRDMWEGKKMEGKA
ncbi:hypothetical protein LTS18_015078 [Coniosporium uncinatum]|uniref:Uncharacterized protein n=1 Tax=Coniosporium uncinatum TaxID=93489 RepID=A0ACC3DUW0_9PEZI|nr:hypothetical protein LTS18_015078 [Coniosporium uncinatum]